MPSASPQGSSSSSTGTLAIAPRSPGSSASRITSCRAPLPETPFTFLPVSSWRLWQEVALWWPERRILVNADALGTIPFYRAGAEPIGVHPFLRLFPPQALRGLGAEHVLVGHGEGRHGDTAAVEVDDALAHARRRIPRWLAGLRRATGDQT